MVTLAKVILKKSSLGLNKRYNDRMTDLSKAPLGKKSSYIDQYDAQLLFAIARQAKRDEIGISTSCPFSGQDIWNAYELSWLNPKGKPVVATAVITVPCETPNICESKSLKLYLNSFNQTAFNSIEQVRQTLIADLSATTGGDVCVELILPQQFCQQHIQELPGDCLDDLDIDIHQYKIDANLLQTSDINVTETLKSHLLKSNCLITSQPDWASIMIQYTGKKIDRASLLKYIISFRQHNEFHEQCVERIFMDIMHHCQPTKLTVYARYLRRGGIDINPWRSNVETDLNNGRNYRQ